MSAAFSAVAEKFHDGRLPFAVLHLDEGQTLRAKALGVFGHGLDLALRGAGEALGVERLHHAAIGNRAAEHLEGAGLEFLGEIRQFHARSACPACRCRSGSALPRR